jgi:hypothetical protein
MHKFTKYDNREECSDHLHKLGLKYLNEKNINLDTLDFTYLNNFKATIQKAIDETDSKLLECYQDPSHHNYSNLKRNVLLASLAVSGAIVLAKNPSLLTNKLFLASTITSSALCYQMHRCNLNFQ